MNQQLAAALAAEEAAIYAYGVIGVRLANAGEKAEARATEQAHRDRRDYLVVVSPSPAPAPAPAGYRLPFPVHDRATALKLAIRIEDAVAQVWRQVLPVSTGAGRTTALAALTDAAVRATRWRRLAKVSPVTMPFPGRPG